MYKCKADNVPFTLSKEEQELCNQATEHHILNNKHHPEYWSDKKTNLISTADRDKPNGEIINATKMPTKYLMEMCADWCAVSEERGTDPFDWAKSNINIRWLFTEKQAQLINDFLSIMWGEE